MTDRVFNRAQSRRVDQIAIDEFAMPGSVLMENAGSGCARLLLSRPPCRTCVVCCGTGNNGGDGLVIARHLANAGVEVKALVFGEPSRLSELTALQMRILSHTSIDVRFQADPASFWLSEQLAQVAGQPVDWLVDALLGTGSSGQVRPPLDRVVAAMNAATGRRLAVDLPTGLDCDRPQIAGESGREIVRADLTATMVALKPCLLDPRCQAYGGEVVVIDIGVPREILRQVEAAATALESQDTARR